MRVLVCGSRRFENRAQLWARLDELPREGLHMIVGGARGADEMAEAWAKARAVPITVVPADWQRHGTKAGPIRNRQMLDMAPDLVLAFPWRYGYSPGTRDCARAAKERGIPVEWIVEEWFVEAPA